MLFNFLVISGNTYEPPLTNAFTMQWFLTLFCNCLPHSTVLRVWDLIFLEGNQVLLKTALAIWDTLSEFVSFTFYMYFSRAAPQRYFIFKNHVGIYIREN